MTTDAIDEAVHNWTIEAGAYPSPLHYKGFPKSVCTSVNNVAAHGIPDLRSLHNGDIINVDVTVSHLIAFLQRRTIRKTMNIPTTYLIIIAVG